jgi:D-alanyl-D-alanine endopeptidase (penicillin-binding protein 7)
MRIYLSVKEFLFLTTEKPRAFLALFVLVFFAFTIIIYNHTNKPIYAYDNSGRTLDVKELSIDNTTDNSQKKDPLPFPAAKEKKDNQASAVSSPLRVGKNEIYEGVNGAVIDCQSGDMLYDNSADKPVQIASITKLATSLIFLRHNIGWDNIYTITERDMVGGGKNHIRIGDKLSIRNLFFLSLITSENNATMALANSTGLKKRDFVSEMNALALELGLEKTNFNDPIGLSQYNVSVPREIAILAKNAFANTDIMDAVSKHEVSFASQGGAQKTVASTNELFKKNHDDDISVLGGKTGYTSLAGYCFVGKFTNAEGKEVISVILGEERDSARFKNSEMLARSVYKNYKWY